MDIDKRNEYGNVVQLKGGSNNTSPIRIINNPLANKLDVQFNHPAGPGADISLFDMGGKKVYGTKQQVMGG